MALISMQLRCRMRLMLPSTARPKLIIRREEVARLEIVGFLGL